MAKNYKLDRQRSIGTVLFVVEGGSPLGGAELRLLKRIFSDLLGYEMQELRRGTEEFIGHRSNPKSRVIGMNLPQNQISKITEERMNELYARIRDQLGLKPENYPLFFLYDRDVKSYKPNELRRFVTQHTDPYSSDSGELGQLLLSYPAVESYMVSCFRENAHLLCYQLGKDLKPDAADWGCTIEAIENEGHILHAAREMDAALAALGCGEYDLDHLESTLLASYDAQQSHYKGEGSFSLLSLISMALLELGILTEDDSVESTRKD